MAIGLWPVGVHGSGHRRQRNWSWAAGCGPLVGFVFFFFLCTKLAHVTRDSDTTFKVRRSKVKVTGGGTYCHIVAASRRLLQCIILYPDNIVRFGNRKKWLNVRRSQFITSKSFLCTTTATLRLWTRWNICHNTRYNGVPFVAIMSALFINTTRYICSESFNFIHCAVFTVHDVLEPTQQTIARAINWASYCTSSSSLTNAVQPHATER